MSAESSRSSDVLGSDVRRLLDEFAVSQAADFARAGVYDRAESLLRPVIERGDGLVDALDLQARVCAQQGRLNEAAQWWQRVLEKEPTHAAARTALLRMHRMQTQPIWLQVAWPVAVGFGVLLCGLLLFAWQDSRQAAVDADLRHSMAEAIHGESRAADLRNQELRTEIRTVMQKQEQLEANLAKLSEKLATPPAVVMQATEITAEMKPSGAVGVAGGATTAAEGASPHQGGKTRDHAHAASWQMPSSLLARLKKAKVEVGVPQTEPLVHQQSIQLTFKGTLFQTGTRFKPDADSRLKSVAGVIAAVDSLSRIEVIGCTADERYSTKRNRRRAQSLALDRANMAAKYFIRRGFFKPGVLTVGSAQGRCFSSKLVSGSSTAQNAILMMRVFWGLR